METVANPKEAVALGLVELFCETVTKSLKETVADSTWIQSTVAVIHMYDVC